MENLSHSRQPTRVSHTSATKRACNGGSFTGKNTYDDVFGGPPRFGGPSLSPRPEDYSEIFGGFHASRATSIPVLDLPLLGDEEMFFEVRSSSFDYGEVFGGFNGLDFAASFEELMRQANSGGDRDHDGDSSDEAWTPAETECLSEESDHSGLDQYSFNGDSYEPINSSKEFNISYRKTDQRSSQDMYNGVTRVAELHSLPECAHVFEETIPLDKAHGQNPEVHVTDDDVNLEFPAGQMREKHLSKMLYSSNRAVDEVKAIGNLESQSTDGRIGSYSNQPFVTISEISLRTQPSELPPPTRPPPMLDSNKGDCWDNKTPTADRRTGDNSPPYFDVEIDASSAAAASAAAMKEAMENAQAKLRSAKEVMERKGHGVQTHKRVPSKHGGMDKREKARKIADESFDMDDEPLQRAHEKGKHEEKISVTYDGGKAMITTQMLPGSIEGEKHFSVTKKYMEDKQTRKLKSSKGVYNVNGADEWQEAAQFFDLVRTDKLVLEEVREANLLLKNPKIHEPQQKQGKVVTEALKQQRETETEVTTVRQDHDLEKIERDLRLAKEAYWKPESNGRPDVEKQAVQVKVNEKKFEVPQDVSKLEKNATKSRTTQHHSERGKKIPEANEAENHGRIETRPADNELEIEQVRTYNTYDDPKLQQKQSKHGEMPERGHERKLVLSFEQSDNEKMLKRSLEQEEKERKLKEVRRREEKKKKEKEACGQEEKAQKKREAREREEKEKREGEAREREKEKKDWEARQPEEREKERELRKREEQENKEKEARKREEEEKRKRDELKRKEHEWEEMEARKMEEEDRRIREALIQEKQKMKQTEACKREEEEKRKKEMLKRQEQERKEREARKQEEEAKKERERLEQEENERKQREAFEREENARKEKEWLELEESERIWRMALEQLENERILKQTFWHSENDEKTRKDPEAEELEKKQKEVHEIKEKDRKPRQTADMVKNEKQQKGTVKVEETETRHQLAHEKETNNGLEDASRKEGHGRTNTKFHEKEGIEKMVVIDDKDIRPKEALDGEGEKKSEDVSVHEETKEVKSEHDTCYKFQKEKIVENMKTVEGNDDLQLENGLKLPAEALEQDTTRKLLDDDDLSQREAKNQAKSVGDEARRNSEKIKSTSRVECNRENQESKFTNGHSGRGKSMETASNQLGKLEKSVSTQALKESTEAGRKADVAKSLFSEGKANVQKISQQVKTSHATEKKDNSIREIHAAEQAGRIKKEREMEMERLRKMEEQREREREREKDRMAVDRVTREARDGAYAESRERAERTAVERATAEARNRTLAEARERLEKACSEAREKSYTEARLRADRTAVERATTEARERAMEKAMAERAAADTNERIERSLSDKYSSSRNNEMRGLKDQQFLRAETFGGSRFSSAYNGVEGESAQRCKARLDRYRRTAERAAKALEEKNMRDLLAQKEQAERHRLAETLGADVKRWASGKEGNLRALLSTLQYILGPDSGWQPIPLTEVITSAAVKKAYRRATLCVHPDKLQQRGASIQQKYICEKVFDLLKEAWNKFNSEER